MHRTLTRRTALALTATLALGLSACGGDEQAGGGENPTLRIGVSPVPHGEILQEVADSLPEDAGYSVEIVEFTDYIQPNEALEAGDLAANYSQHQPYLDEQVQARGYDFEALGPVHLEPLGLYSEQVDAPDALGEDSEIAIPNDPSNGGRALQLLADHGILELADTGDKAPTVDDVTSGPEITELEAAQLPRSLGDVDAAVVNGNYAIEADLSPKDDALAVEDAQDNPYANLLVTTADRKDDEHLTKLLEALQSQETEQFIDEQYDGAVIAAR